MRNEKEEEKNSILFSLFFFFSIIRFEKLLFKEIFPSIENKIKNNIWLVRNKNMRNKKEEEKNSILFSLFFFSIIRFKKLLFKEIFPSIEIKIKNNIWLVRNKNMRSEKEEEKNSILFSLFFLFFSIRFKKLLFKEIFPSIEIKIKNIWLVRNKNMRNEKEEEKKCWTLSLLYNIIVSLNSFFINFFSIIQFQKIIIQRNFSIDRK